MGKSKLTNAQIDEIYNLVAAGFRSTAVAKQFGMSHSAVKYIARGLHSRTKGKAIKFRLDFDEKMDIYYSILKGASKSDMMKKYGVSVYPINTVLKGTTLGLPPITYDKKLKFSANVIIAMVTDVIFGMYQTKACKKYDISSGYLSKILRKEVRTEATTEFPSFARKKKSAPSKVKKLIDKLINN